jgi:peptidoglycan-N-acetylglucosamine deacetylase
MNRDENSIGSVLKLGSSIRHRVSKITAVLGAIARTRRVSGAFVLTIALAVVSCVQPLTAPVTPTPRSIAVAPTKASPTKVAPMKVVVAVMPTVTSGPTAVRGAVAPKVLAAPPATLEPILVRRATPTIPPTVVPTLVPTATTTSTATLEPGSSAIVVRRVTTTEKVIALTYDAGSDRGEAATLLAYLEGEGIKVTFGMTGRWAESNPDLLRRIVADGDELMNHTYDHRSMTGVSAHPPVLTRPDRIAEIAQTEAIVQSLAGATMKPFFRPPYGDEDQSVLEDVAAAGYRYSVLWTVDSLGWQGASVAQIVDRCLRYAQPGAIYVLHVGAQSQDIAATHLIVDGLKAQGYRFVTMSELMAQATR